MKSLKTNDIQEFESQFPLISKAGKENPFHIPDDYFENLPASIQESCNEIGKKKKYFTFINFKFNYIYFSSAICILFLVLLFNPLTKKYFIQPSIQPVTSLSDYLLTYENIDEETIAEFLTDNTNDSSNDITEEYLSNDDLLSTDSIN